MSRIILALAALGILLLLLAGVTDQRVPSPPSRDLAYFQAMSGHLSGSLELSDASMQVKAVAARRHASVADVHRLLQDYTDNDSRVPPADRRVDLNGLNQKLDELWPMK